MADGYEVDSVLAAKAIFSTDSRLIYFNVAPGYPQQITGIASLGGSFEGKAVTGVSAFGNPLNAVSNTTSGISNFPPTPIPDLPPDPNSYVGYLGLLAYAGHVNDRDYANGISFALSDATAVHFFLQEDQPSSYSVHYETSDGTSGPINFYFYPGNQISEGVPTPLPCFVAETRLQTMQGEVTVKMLREGDLVVTPSGLRPVRWVGHSIVHPPRTPDPRTAHPIRIRAHAFADGVPARDLRVSPGHALLVGEVLINAGELVNGGTIVQEEATRVDYYHVELDSHDILIAEGMPCESYLDDGNRASFINGADHVALHGRIDRASEATCRPLVKSGPLLVEARARLLARALDLGWVLAEAPGLRLRVGEEEIAPVAEAGRAAWFLLPAGAAGPVRLRSAAAIVDRIAPERADDRRLGVAIGGLRIDGAEVALDDAAFGAGWYAPETDGHEGWRWMDGDAALTLPPGARMIEVRLQIVLPMLQRVRMAEAVAA